MVGIDCVSLIGGKFFWGGGQKRRVTWGCLADILVKGTFGPMASAFSICALVENWRVMIPPGGTESNGVEEKDPRWCVFDCCMLAILLSLSLTLICLHRAIAINAISLALALVANFALLLNMARRLSFSIAQPLTIAGWYLASVLLVALIAVTSHGLKLPPGQDRALTQAFYYAIIAAALYFIIATLMSFTVYGAFREHYPREFELTTIQRTLMLQTIVFMVYLLAGAAVYARVESWKFLDAVYFAEFTLLTVGIGDIAPLTHLGRSLLFPYAIGGIVILGLVIGSIRSLVLDRGKKKIDSRMLEKKRERFVKQMKTSEDITKLNPVSNEKEAKEAGMPEYERRKQEFELMRTIQNQISVRQKWMALLISSSAWFLLWFIGALVFYKAEGKQGWTYFQSLYFAYTSLLTIGYGDFAPFSNSGKPFFVFWSLLVVPTLTILISDMGDTVIKWVQDLTLKLGELTVLPGEVSTRDRIKQRAIKLSKGKFSSKGGIMDESPGFLGEKKDESNGKEGQVYQGRATDPLAGEQEQEGQGALNLAKHQDKKYLDENPHRYHFLLIKELRNVMKHIKESPPRKYTYDEWVWLLKLMGEDESSNISHRKPPAEVKAANNPTKKDFHSAELQQGQTNDKDGRKLPWSWLGTRSPLMGEAEEAEWVLERLSARLEERLLRVAKAHKVGNDNGGGNDGEKRMGLAQAIERVEE